MRRRYTLVVPGTPRPMIGLPLYKALAELRKIARHQRALITGIGNPTMWVAHPPMFLGNLVAEANQFPRVVPEEAEETPQERWEAWRDRTVDQKIDERAWRRLGGYARGDE